MIDGRNVSIITDEKGNKIVLINDIVFKGKRNVDALVRYNVFGARLLVNHAENNKKYLYDILAIKKKRASHNNKCGENPFLIL